MPREPRAKNPFFVENPEIESTWALIREFPFRSKKEKNRKICKMGKNVNIGNSQISLHFYVLACFPLVSDSPMVREQNGKYHIALIRPLKGF